MANGRPEANEGCPLGPSLNVGKADDIARGGLGLSTQKCLGEKKKVQTPKCLKTAGNQNEVDTVCGIGREVLLFRDREGAILRLKT